MDFFAYKKDTKGDKVIVADDMILTSDMPTTAGSKMLEGYMSPFEAEVITRARAAGYEIGGKARVGEFAIDLLGETAFDYEPDGDIIKNAAAELVKSGEASAAICLDVNGSVRRAVAQNGLFSIKPTYGTVSRYGTIPVACSGETVSVMAKSAAECEELLKAIAGHDTKDGTSHSDEACKKAFEPCEPKGRVLLIEDLYELADAAVKAKIDETVSGLEANGIEVVKDKCSNILKARAAWNILMSAELCNNVSRYDGVKYGYRSSNYTNIDELYTNSRTESFGELLKTAIIYGSETLSTDNYMKVYDKAMRVRRVICECLGKALESYDLILMPACSSMEYKKELIESDKYISYSENIFTAPASISGLPALVCGGVQLVGGAFSESMLFDYAKICERMGE